MAARNLLSIQNYPQLQRFVIRNARPTGKKLGSGSYGSVEEVEVNGVVCAGKIIFEALLQPGFEGVPNIVRKYVEECELLSDLRHPHIVQFIGVCFLPGSSLPVLVMERLLMSLDDLLENTPDIPLSLKRSMLADVAKGLVYLHNRSSPIIHRDLSAKNVLLTSAMVAKITDLGNSRIVHILPDKLAKTLSCAPGTLVYMAPEALYSPHDCPPTKSRYGTRIDIFSFGHLALYTLIQEFPQDLLAPTQEDLINPGQLVALTEVERRKNYIDKLHQQLGERHPLVRMIKQCLHNTPMRRPTADEVLQQLEGMRSHSPDPYQHLNKLEMINLVQSLQAQMQKQANQSQKTVESLQAQIEEMEMDISAMVMIQASLDSELQQKEANIQELQRKIRALQEHVSAKDKSLQEKEASTRELQRSMRALKIQLQDHFSLETEALTEQVSAKDALLQSKEKSINSLRKEIQALRQKPLNLEYDSGKPDQSDGNSETQDLAAFLSIIGIECPVCHNHHQLRSESIHFYCSNCFKEFCCGCGKLLDDSQLLHEPFRAHHPRDCIYHLWDFSIHELERFLRNNNIPFEMEPSQKHRGQMTCGVMLRKDRKEVILNEKCGERVHEGHNGLCVNHYKEYLIININQAKLDPITLFTTTMIEEMLRREKKEVPAMGLESWASYKERLIKAEMMCN